MDRGLIRHALLLRDIARLIARLATSTPDKAADKAVGKKEIFPIPPAPSSLAAPAVPKMGFSSDQRTRRPNCEPSPTDALINAAR